MKSNDKPISEFELQAYVDDELDSVRRAEVEQYLQQNPHAADEIEVYKSYNKGLQDLFNPVLEERVPKRISNTLNRTKTYNILARVASFVIAVFTGLLIGWVLRGEYQPFNGELLKSDLVRNAFAYHSVYTPEIRHPVEVTVEQEKHLVKWLSNRLKTPVKAPGLNSFDFELLGGRLLSSDGEPAAQFMYENSEGQRLTLFTRHRENSESETSFQYASQKNVNGFYWIDRNLSFVLLGDIQKSDIANIAQFVYDDLNR